MDSIDPRILALAFAAVWFVQVGVDVVKQTLGPDVNTGRWTPVFGILIAWIVVGAQQVYQRVEATPDNIAGTLLAGIVAYYLAASAMMAHAKAGETMKQKRVEKVREAGKAAA